MRNHYHTLGIAQTATTDEIVKAYRLLAAKLHPDANGGNAFFTERFKELNEAYSVLSDENSRTHYDQLIAGDFNTVPANTVEPNNSSELIPDEMQPSPAIRDSTARAATFFIIVGLVAIAVVAFVHEVNKTKSADAELEWIESTSDTNVNSVTGDVADGNELELEPVPVRINPLTGDTLSGGKSNNNSVSRNQKNKSKSINKRPNPFTEENVGARREMAAPPTSFTIGSTKKTVLQVQGDPTSVSKFGNTEIWRYDAASVTFEYGVVEEYSNYGNRLRVKMSTD